MNEVKAAARAPEIEFFDDGHVELERCTSRGVADAPDALTQLLACFDE